MKMSGTTELVEIKSEGGELRVCRGCLATDLPLFDLRSESLAQAFGDFTGIPVLPMDIYPKWACGMCKYLLSKFFAFRLRCHSAMYVIQRLVQDGVEVSTESISALETNYLKPNLKATNIQVISYECSMDTNEVNNLSNVPPAKAVKSINLTNEDSDNDIYLFADGKKDENPDITALFVGDLGDGDNRTFSALSKSDGCTSDTESNDKKLPTKRGIVNEENVAHKRLKIKNKDGKNDDKIDESGDVDNKDSYVLSESDEWPSDSEMNNRKQKENVKCKIPRDEETEGRIEINSADEEQDIIRSIRSIIVICNAQNDCRGESYTALWEKVYQQSLKESHELLDFEDFSQLSLEQMISQYICLSKKLAAMYNFELKFSCLAEQKKEIEDRRKSEKYQKAPFKCELCCKHYSFEDTYKRHMVFHHPKSGDLVCKVCAYRYKRRRPYREHYQSNHAEKTVKSGDLVCKVCSYRYKRCRPYREHYQCYHAEKIVCKDCGIIKRHWADAKEHFESHGGATTVCGECGQHFAERKLYMMHIRSVHRQTFATELCLLCGDTYNGAAGLRKHIHMSHRECPKCGTCKTVFASEEALATHNLESGTGCGELSACPVCGHNFPSEHSMREHYDTLHKKEQFKCDQCGRVMQMLTQYKRHLQKCLARKRNWYPERRKAPPGLQYQVFMCEVCGKGNFRCYALLREHQRTHTGEKPFKCDLCGKCFRVLQLLKNHLVTHTDERRYKCPHCPKAFHQQSHRVAHILTHTKERPFSCDLCDKSYTGLGSLREHKDTVHKGLPPRQRKRRKSKAEELEK